ncbi:MAG: methionine--tRNA ligase subunit beta, partial [Acidobacteriota bacterium]
LGFVSAQVPVRDGRLLFSGRVGVELTPQQGKAAAEIAALKSRSGRPAGSGAGMSGDECSGLPAGETGQEAEGIEDGLQRERTVPMSPEETGPLQGADEPQELAPLRPQVVIDDFLKCDFRLGRILEAEVVPGSKKLLKFTIDIGLETRTILAGIQQNYAPEDLKGKMVVVIANLAPRRMMGFTSQGMVLAAEVDGKLSVLTPLTDGLRPGARLS